MNLARIKLMALLLHALCIVQTVSLHKLADAMPTTVDKDSNLRRLQRFFAKYVLVLDIIARMIFSLLRVKNSLVLSEDRTNWKFGEFNINILILGITYKGIAFPLIFSLLPKRGNSNWQERRELMERFMRLFITFSYNNVLGLIFGQANELRVGKRKEDSRDENPLFCTLSRGRTGTDCSTGV